MSCGLTNRGIIETPTSQLTITLDIYQYCFKHIDTVAIKKLIRYVVPMIYCPALFLSHAIRSSVSTGFFWNKNTLIKIYITIQYLRIFIGLFLVPQSLIIIVDPFITMFSMLMTHIHSSL